MAKRNRTPAAVTKAAARADQLHAEIYGAPKAEPDIQEPAAEAPAQDTQDIEAGGEIQPVEAPETSQASDTDTKEPSPPAEVPLEATPAAEPAPEPAPAEPEPVDEWKNKYLTLQGKYNAEVPRLNAAIGDLRREMAELQKAPVAAAPVTETEKSVVSDSDVVDYGQDLIDLIRRVSANEVTTQTKDLTPKIEQIAGQVQQSRAQTATERVYAKLDTEVQDWREINRSDGFIQWLGTADPYAGALRKDLLKTAFEQADPERVSAFFKGYLVDAQVVNPPQDPNPTPTPAPKAQIALGDLAGPVGGPSTAVVDPNVNQAPNWTRAQIATFYTDVQKGHYKDKPDKKTQIENSIAAALQTGRIQ